MSKDAVDDLRKPPGDRDSAAHLTIWQVNFADDQILELTQAEIQQDLASGNLTRNNWVWREGMAGWLPIGDVPELASPKRESVVPPSGFRARPDDEVESVPLDAEDDEKTVALKNPAFLGNYERGAPTLEFSIDADEESTEPPTARAPAVGSSVVPSRIESIGPDKTPALGSVVPPPQTSSAPPGVTRSSPAGILLRGSAPPTTVVKASAPPTSAKISAPPAGGVRISAPPLATKISSPPALKPTPAPTAKAGAPSRESPPPLPARKPIIPVSVSSSPVAAPRPIPTPSPDAVAPRATSASGSVFPPPSPGSELVAPRPIPLGELGAPKQLPSEPLVATPAPPEHAFEDLGLLVAEELKSDIVWPAPDPGMARSDFADDPQPPPLPAKPVVAIEPPKPEPAKPEPAKPEPVKASPKPEPVNPAAAAEPVKATAAAEPAKTKPASPSADEPLVIVAGQPQPLDLDPEEQEKSPPIQDLPPKPVLKQVTPIVVRELPASKAQLVDIRSTSLLNESTLITGRRRTRHWVSLTNAVIGAICAACIASALTALVMQATEQSRWHAAGPSAPAAAAPAVAAATQAEAMKAPEPAPQPEPTAEASAAAAPAGPSALPVPAVTPEPKPSVMPEQPVAAAPPPRPAAKKRPGTSKTTSTNPYDDIETQKSDSSKRGATPKPASDGVGVPSNPGF